jgi:phage shock protein A
MGVLSRLQTLIKSNVNSLVDRMSDPGREVDVLVTEMEDALKQARREVQQALTSEKLAIKERDRLGAESASWEAKATRALHAGDDSLAREALAEKARVDGVLAEAERAAHEQQAYVDELTASLKTLEQRVSEVRLRRGTLKQQARSQAGRDPLRPGRAFGEFDRLADGVEAAAAEVELDEELRGPSARDEETSRKLRELERQSKAEDALAELKKKLQK